MKNLLCILLIVSTHCAALGQTTKPSMSLKAECS